MLNFLQQTGVEFVENSVFIANYFEHICIRKHFFYRY